MSPTKTSPLFQIVAPELGLSLSETGKPLELIRRKGSLKIISNTEKATIYYQEKAHLFRGLLLWMQADTDFVHEETPQFDQIGPYDRFISKCSTDSTSVETFHFVEQQNGAQQSHAIYGRYLRNS